MIGIFITTLSILALYQMFITGSGLITEEYHRRAGLEIVQKQLDILKSYRTQLDSIPQRLQGTFPVAIIPEQNSQGEVALSGTYSISIHPCAARDVNNVPFYSDCLVNLIWVEHSGHRQELKMRAYL
jgi:hypothetical protein